MVEAGGLIQEVCLEALGGILSVGMPVVACQMRLPMMPCFTGETPVITRRGSIRFDELTDQDDVASRDENNPDGPVEFKRVEEIFCPVASIWHLHVGGQVIRTTAAHPFWVLGKGWLPARELQPSDMLVGVNGERSQVEEVIDANYVEAVYNCRVADYHTYFVGGTDWGFSVWAHNNCSSTSGNNAASAVGRARHTQFSNTMNMIGRRNGGLNVGSYTLRNGRRVDGLRFNSNGPGGIVYELKPRANPRSTTRGLAQLNGPNGYISQLQAEFGGNWRGIVIYY